MEDGNADGGSQHTPAQDFACLPCGRLAIGRRHFLPRRIFKPNGLIGYFGRVEQLLIWNPDVILFAPGSIYQNVGQDAAWQQLTAIKNGTYYEVPFGPYN